VSALLLLLLRSQRFQLLPSTAGSGPASLRLLLRQERARSLIANKEEGRSERELAAEMAFGDEEPKIFLLPPPSFLLIPLSFLMSSLPRPLQKKKGAMVQ